MSERRSKKIIPFEKFSQRISYSNTETPVTGSKVISLKRYLNKKLIEPVWKQEEERLRVRPEIDLREEGIFSLDSFRAKKGLHDWYAMMDFNFHAIEKARDFKDVQKGVREAVKEEMKRKPYLVHSSETVHDPMIFKRDRGFWMRREALELFEI